jgi:hypothetical protein
VSALSVARADLESAHGAPILTSGVKPLEELSASDLVSAALIAMMGEQ